MGFVSENVKNLVARLGRTGPCDVEIGDLGLAGVAGRVYVPVSGSGGALKTGRRGRSSIPGLVFGHDWQANSDAYHVTLRHLASWGIAVAAPDTEQGLVPDHRGFAADMESALQILTGVTLGSGKMVVDPSRLYLAGHGMGAGAAVLAATGRVAVDAAGAESHTKTVGTPAVAGVIAIYPSDTTPSCYEAAGLVEAPGLILDAGRPGVLHKGNAQRLAAEWRGQAVYRKILAGSPSGIDERIVRKVVLGGSGMEFGVQALVRALAAGFIIGDGAVNTKEAKACAVLRRPHTEVKGTLTLNRRELFESLPEFADPMEKLQDAIQKL